MCFRSALQYFLSPFALFPPPSFHSFFQRARKGEQHCHARPDCHLLRSPWVDLAEQRWQQVWSKRPIYSWPSLFYHDKSSIFWHVWNHFSFPSRARNSAQRALGTHIPRGSILLVEDGGRVPAHCFDQYLFLHCNILHGRATPNARAFFCIPCVGNYGADVRRGDRICCVCFGKGCPARWCHCSSFHVRLLGFVYVFCFLCALHTLLLLLLL